MKTRVIQIEVSEEDARRIERAGGRVRLQFDATDEVSSRRPNPRGAFDALAASSPQYVETTLAQRNPGGSAQAGSVFAEPQTLGSLMRARWSPYAHPNVAPIATAFRAEIPGRLGVLPLEALSPNTPVRFQAAHAGALGDTAEVVAVFDGDLLEVSHTTLLAGPTREDPEAFVMWTVFPGDPVPMQAPIALSPLLSRYPGGVATAADAIREGFYTVKQVPSLRQGNPGLPQEKTACPLATRDLAVNTRNRNSAIREDYIQYGPLYVDAPGDFWKRIAAHWRTPEASAKQALCGNCVAFDVSPRMDACMPGPVSDNDGRLGYCWMHHFKCHSARTCRTWAKGGPITSNAVSAEWQRRNEP